MGRPSRVHIRIDGTAAEITRVRVGGSSVLVGEGRLRILVGRSLRSPGKARRFARGEAALMLRRGEMAVSL